MYLCAEFLFMDDFIFSVNVVAPLFLLMAAGYVARRFNLVSDKFLSEATSFVFRFLLPLMLFQNIRTVFYGNFYNISLVFAAISGISVIIIASFIFVPLFVKRNGQRGSMIQGIYRSNFVIYGMPLATGMYGHEAAYSIAMLLCLTVPIYNTVAVITLSLFSETRTKRFSLVQLATDIVRNPLILGCVTGIIFGVYRIDLPSAINQPISELAAAASPLALFLMGGDFTFRSLNNNLLKVFLATIVRLIIIPLVAVIVFIPMGFRNIELSVLLCLFATPTAVASYIMASNMGCDGELAGQIVVMTTTFSCFSIFLFIFVLRSFGFL